MKAATPSGWPLLLVAHDTTNLANGTGGPPDPAVLYRPDDVVADVRAAGIDLRVERAETVERPVVGADRPALAGGPTVRRRTGAAVPSCTSSPRSPCRRSRCGWPAVCHPRRALPSCPQGPNTSRVYLAHFDVHRYAGPDGSARYLADLAQCASPDVASLSSGRLVTPIATHTSVDTWTDEPFAPGVVVIGDAAGYNDPIVGQGLSLTIADVRDVARVILNGGRTPEDFGEYAQRRSDRHAKQRVSAPTMAEMMCAFGAEHEARRLRALPLLGTDELVGALVGVLFAGPDILPPGTDVLVAARERFLAA